MDEQKTRSQAIGSIYQIKQQREDVDVRETVRR